MTTKDQLRAAQQEIAALRAQLAPPPVPPPSEALAANMAKLSAGEFPSPAPARAPNGSPRPKDEQEPAAQPKTPRAPGPVRQPTHFLQSRSKLPPMPKRKPFVIPGDPAK